MRTVTRSMRSDAGVTAKHAEVGLMRCLAKELRRAASA